MSTLAARVCAVVCRPAALRTIALRRGSTAWTTVVVGDGDPVADRDVDPLVTEAAGQPHTELAVLGVDDVLPAVLDRHAGRGLVRFERVGEFGSPSELAQIESGQRRFSFERWEREETPRRRRVLEGVRRRFGLGREGRGGGANSHLTNLLMPGDEDC